MKLTVTEELLLALYLEFFDRQYDIFDSRKYDIGPGKKTLMVRHVEVQNLFYFFQNLYVYVGDFGFCWNFRGPHSERLQLLLNSLDQKEKAIEEYYKEYNIKKSASQHSYSDLMKGLLPNYITSGGISKVARACTLLQDIVKQEMGSEALASIIYVYITWGQVIVY